jgi:hypothetical protein
MKQRVVREEVTKKSEEPFPPSKPSVPGPAASAKTFIKAKEPLMIPKPRPDTTITESETKFVRSS